MSIEHDRIHLETSSMLFRQLPADMLQKPDAWQYAPTHGAAPQNEMLPVPGGAVRLGKDRNYPRYGWDNEYGSLTVEVAPFRAGKYYVTNGEYLAFMQDNGYQERRYWDDESWGWREQHNVTRPKFWGADGDDFRYRTVFDEIALPWNWPVEVNHHEAMAYCRWQGEGARLLTEAEWNLIARDLGVDIPEGNAYNLNLKYCSPSAVTEHAASPLGFHDAVGNVWTWLADDFRPLPGFATHPLYEDYSAPFFDDRHSVLVGGSWATTGAQTTRFCRNWFRRHFYQHAGFRVARSDSGD
jgi:5-histidylcysteine sulfoxide synthase